MTVSTANPRCSLGSSHTVSCKFAYCYSSCFTSVRPSAPRRKTKSLSLKNKMSICNYRESSAAQVTILRARLRDQSRMRVEKKKAKKKAQNSRASRPSPSHRTPKTCPKQRAKSTGISSDLQVRVQCASIVPCSWVAASTLCFSCRRCTPSTFTITTRCKKRAMRQESCLKMKLKGRSTSRNIATRFRSSSFAKRKT